MPIIEAIVATATQAKTNLEEEKRSEKEGFFFFFFFFSISGEYSSFLSLGFFFFFFFFLTWNETLVTK